MGRARRNERIRRIRRVLRTSDARRFVVRHDTRLGHLLAPRTRWPVADAPRSVTVIADTCIEARTLATLACLRGLGTREFLVPQGVLFRLS